MRRTQARQVETPPGRFSFAAMPCRRCGKRGVSLVSLGRNDNGAIELAWCSPECATRDGWPFLASEKGRGASRGRRR